MNTTATLQQLKDLKLSGMVRSYESVLQLSTHQQPEAHTMLAQLCDAEQQNRIHCKTLFYLKLSKLRYAAMLEEISFSKDRNLPREQVHQLADCSYIDRAENILISGSTGSGKSFLACAFGHQACVMGYKTLYLNLNRFTEKLMMAKLDGTFVKLLNHLERTSLLILDDFGLAPMDQNTRLALLQILEDRYAKFAPLARDTLAQIAAVQSSGKICPIKSNLETSCRSSPTSKTCACWRSSAFPACFTTMPIQARGQRAPTAPMKTISRPSNFASGWP